MYRIPKCPKVDVNKGTRMSLLIKYWVCSTRKFILRWLKSWKYRWTNKLMQETKYVAVIVDSKPAYWEIFDVTMYLALIIRFCNVNVCMSWDGWPKPYHLELLRASEGTLSRWTRLHLQSLAPTNPQRARVVGYGPFSLWLIHKEGLCPSSGDINRLMIICKYPKRGG
jgi:hypothetical protein